MTDFEKNLFLIAFDKACDNKTLNLQEELIFMLMKRRVKYDLLVCSNLAYNWHTHKNTVLYENIAEDLN